MDRDELTKKIGKALRTQFPNVTEEHLEKWANEIFYNYSTASTLEGMERSDRPPSHDFKDLMAAATSLRAVAKKVEGVGWHGQEALLEAANAYASTQSLTPWPYRVNILDAATFASGAIRKLVDDLEAAANKIDPCAASLKSVFQEGDGFFRSRGKPEKTAVYFTTEVCRRAFEELSGQRATVITEHHPSDTRNGTEYKPNGPYLNFLKTMFEALDLKASPENWARNSTSSGRRRKMPPGAD